MNELAANARRERKVLDLEISNSSLLAINRTLERELRKQNAELRRFRRLSRSGRMSIAPSSRSVSGAMSTVSQTDTLMDSEDLVSSSDDDDDHSTDPTSDVSSPTSNPEKLSPSRRAARERFHDPKGIQLDLAAHRALLVDSQKLNFSIKRCLGYSEAMIASAKQALEYQVPASEPMNELGARVLSPDDIDESVFTHGQGLLSPSPDREGINPWEQTLKTAGAAGDGLETPDYSQWGPVTEVQTPAMENTKAESPVLDNTSVDSPTTTMNAEPGSNAVDEERRVSVGPSLDGLDEDPVAYTGTRRNSPSSDSNESEQDATLPAKEFNRTHNTKSPDPHPGQPGYRGSMQGLGHYLQAFSIFGTSQQTRS